MSPSISPAPAVPRKVRLWLALGLGLSLVYALSAGPALMLAQRRVIPTDPVVAIYFSPYSPLQIVTSLVPGADGLMKRYIGFWESLTPEP